MGALYLGVDVGTSSVKLTCIDEGGKVVATASEQSGSFQTVNNFCIILRHKILENL